MPRAKRGFKGRRYHKKVLKAAKGYHGGRSKLIRTAMEAVDHALQYAYVGRKLKKRDYRGSVADAHRSGGREAQGTSYSRLIGDLKKKGSELDRKMLADLAVNHPEDFRGDRRMGKGSVSSPSGGGTVKDSLLSEIAQLRQNAELELAQVADSSAAEACRVKYLGKQGLVTDDPQVAQGPLLHGSPRDRQGDQRDEGRHRGAARRAGPHPQTHRSRARHRGTAAGHHTAGSRDS